MRAAANLAAASTPSQRARLLVRRYVCEFTWVRECFRMTMTDQNLSSFIWSVADLLRGDYKQSEYGKVILPFTVLRRLDCVLEPMKAAVLAEYAARKKQGLNAEPFLLRKAGQSFFNTSPLDMKKLMG